MRRSTIAKFAVVLLLGVGSSVLTSALLSRQHRARASDIGTVTGSISPRVPGAPAPVRNPGRDTSFASGAMRQYSVQVDGKTVFVSAEAYIRDTRPNVRYVWSVRVSDVKDSSKVLFQKLYDTQVFSLPEEREAVPTFNDVIKLPLPSGTYHLEVAPYMVTPVDGLDGTRNPLLHKKLRGPAGVKKITLTD